MILVFAVLLAAGTAAAADTASNANVLPAGKAFSYQKEITPKGSIKLRWSIAPGYYLYRSRLKITGEPSAVKSVVMPAGKLIHDPYFGVEHVFNHNVTMTVTPGNAKRLKLSWQGCAKAGLCYPPQYAVIDVGTNKPSLAADNTVAPPANTDSAGLDAHNGQALAARLAGGAVGWTLLAFFGMGLLLCFTPCVLPMLPILSGLVVGAGARGLRGLSLSLAFVVPMALTYAALGVAAAFAGATFQAALQTPAVLGAFAGLFVILSLAMFGVFELQLPTPIRERLSRVSANRREGHIAGAATLGVLSAVLVGPCMTAPLAGALLYIAHNGNVIVGGLALLCLGLGMGVPLLIVGTAGAQMMPRPGPWMTAVKAVFGFVLLATALWMIQRVLAAPLALGLWGAWLVTIGVTLWQTARVVLGNRLAPSITARSGGALLGLWGVMMVIGAAGGASNPTQPLAFLRGTNNAAPGASLDSTARFDARFHTIHDIQSLYRAVARAKARNQWTLVDFSADWCVSCQVIDHAVFGDPKVQSALAGVQMLRADVTDDNTKTQNLMQQLGVVGPPTIVFIGPNGKARRAARVVGELSAEAFLQHLSRAKQTS